VGNLSGVSIACWLALASQLPEAGTTTFKNTSAHPVTGALLGERNEWIWKQEQAGSTWQKLIPGRCPQWAPDGKRFYYFLDVGYDGSRAELWAADATGESRLRLTESDYFIKDGPVAVSPNNRTLAFVYQTSRASGGFHDVVVVDFNPSPITPSDGRVVLRTRSTIEPQSLTWKSAETLSAVVAGVRIDIDATARGRPQDP
jgi:hypothetical protein